MHQESSLLSTHNKWTFNVLYKTMFIYRCKIELKEILFDVGYILRCHRDEEEYYKFILFPTRANFYDPGVVGVGWCTYMLEASDNSYYTGMTCNIESRLKSIGMEKVVNTLDLDCRLN